jgi:hypothetical protein
MTSIPVKTFITPPKSPEPPPNHHLSQTKHLQTPKMASKTLNFITGNANKLTEVQAILGGVINLQSQKLDLVEIQGTIEEISTDKCRRAADAVRKPFHLSSLGIL